MHFQGTYLRTVPYPNQTLKTNLLITTRQKLKVNLYSDRPMLTLLEYIFSLKSYRVVIEKSVFKV